MGSEEDLLRLRLTADICRRVIRGISDTETGVQLTALMDECEAKLRGIRQRLDARSQQAD